jgi:hypothetical protein
VVQTCRFEKFLKMVFRLLRLAHEVMLGGRDILLARVINFLVIAIIASSDCNVSRALLLSLIATLGTFPSLLMAASDGAAWLLSEAAFELPRMKLAPTTSSKEPCSVEIPSSSLVVLG